jgi:PAS domain S-box-containing protein
MTLRKKTIAVLILAIVMLMLVVYSIMSLLLLNSMRNLEEQHMHENVERFVDALASERTELERTVGDWAAWDETYAFIEDKNDAFIIENLDVSTLVQLNLNLMIFVNAQHEIAFARAADLKSEQAIAVPQVVFDYVESDDTLLNHRKNCQSTSGIVMIDSLPYLIAAHPIVTSYCEGPQRGTLLMARQLNQTVINDLNEQTHLHTTILDEREIDLLTDTQRAGNLLSADTPIVVQALSDYAIVGYTMLQDMHGQPILMARVSDQRDFYLQGKMALYSLMIALVITGIVFGILIMFFLEKVVLRRLALLSTSVNAIGTSGNISRRVTVQGSDELSSLACNMNRMLETLEQAQHSRQQSEARYRAVVEQAAEGIFLLNAKTNQVIESNPAFQQLLGYTAEELTRLDVTDIVAHSARSVHQHIHQVVYYKQRFRGERQYRHRDGSPIDVEVSSVLISQSEQPIICAVVRDVTERKQHERELQAVATVASALRDVPTRCRMIEVIVDQTISLLQVEDVAIVMMVPGGKGMVVELARGHWESLSGRRFQQAEMVETSTAGFVPLLLVPPAIAGTPLIANGRTIGVLCVYRQSRLTDTELRILTAISDIAATAIHRASLYEQTEYHLRELTALHSIDIAVSATLDLSSMLHIFLDQIIAHLPVDGVTLLLYRRHLQTLTYAAGRGEDGIALHTLSYRLGEGQAGRAAMERQIVGLQRSDDGTWHTEPDYALYSRLSKPFPSTYAVPLIARGEVKGVLQMFHRDRLTTDPEWPSFLEALAAHAAIAIDNVQLLQDLQRSRDDLTIAYDATLEGWARALDLRDRETEGHSQRVTAMTVCLAHAMGISEAEIVHVRRGALLHDIGKIGIPDAILLKPGPLTDEERAVMCQHPYYAYTMLAPIAYLRPALDIPYCHHEKWDGSGYPRGLKGEEIPLAARIFAVVDVWDALRSDRPYRNAWPEEKVVSYIEDQAGHHFDPQVVDVFLRLYRENKHQNGCQEITKYSTRRYA